MIKCNECKHPIKYNNQLAFLWPRMGFAVCVKCSRRDHRIIRAKKPVD